MSLSFGNFNTTGYRYDKFTVYKTENIQKAEEAEQQEELQKSEQTDENTTELTNVTKNEDVVPFEMYNNPYIQIEPVIILRHKIDDKTIAEWKVKIAEENVAKAEENLANAKAAKEEAWANLKSALNTLSYISYLEHERNLNRQILFDEDGSITYTMSDDYRKAKEAVEQAIEAYEAACTAVEEAEKELQEAKQKLEDAQKALEELNKSDEDISNEFYLITTEKVEEFSSFIDEFVQKNPVLISTDDKISEPTKMRYYKIRFDKFMKQVMQYAQEHNFGTKICNELEAVFKAVIKRVYSGLGYTFYDIKGIGEKLINIVNSYVLPELEGIPLKYLYKKPKCY